MPHAGRSVSAAGWSRLLCRTCRVPCSLSSSPPRRSLPSNASRWTGTSAACPQSEPSDYNRKYGYTGVDNSLELRLRGGIAPEIRDYRVDGASQVDGDHRPFALDGGLSAELRLSYTKLRYDAGWYVGASFIPMRTHEIDNATATAMAGGLDFGLAWRLAPALMLEVGPFLDLGVCEIDYDTAGVDGGSGNYFAWGGRITAAWSLSRHWLLAADLGWLAGESDGTVRFAGVPGEFDVDLTYSGIIAGLALGYRF